MIESLIKHLAQYAKLEDSIDVERFEATLNQIAELKDARSIGLLIPFLDDQCKFHEVMFSIVHTIEAFDDVTYARELVEALPVLWKRAPYWAKVLHFRIFNHPPSRQAYRAELAQTRPKIKDAAIELLIVMREEESKFATACDEMLAVLRA
jgi:hypothetical protein